MTTFDFKEQLSAGAQGERDIIEFFKDRDFDKFVVDVTDDSVMQDRGIDFIYMSKSIFGWFKNYEIKTDTHEARNFFIELEVADKPGWLHSSCADAVIYYFVERGVAFIIPMPALRMWCGRYLNNHIELNPNSVKAIASGRGSSRWVTLGVTVPVGRLLLDIDDIEVVEVKKGEAC